MESAQHLNGLQKITWAVLLILLLIPAQTEAMLAPADESVTFSEVGASRAKDLQSVKKVLEQKIVQERLQEIGLSQEDINTRLDKLSDGQLHLMAMQVNSLIPAGDNGTVWTIVGILLIVVLVILLATLL